MLDGGADPRYAARRMVRMACEDIGLADPRALRLALDAAEVYERLGSPEGELALAEAIVYLAVAPKSNAVYTAWNAVREQIKRDGTRPVPMHLRNAPTRLMKTLGHGADYRYAHDETDAFAAGETYLPQGLEGLRLYEPVARGLEQRIRERLAELRARNAAARGAWPSCARGTPRRAARPATRRGKPASGTQGPAPRMAPPCSRHGASRSRKARARSAEETRWIPSSSRSSTAWCSAACMRWSRSATRWCTASST
jgi:hypothetical protein